MPKRKHSKPAAGTITLRLGQQGGVTVASNTYKGAGPSRKTKTIKKKSKHHHPVAPHSTPR